MTPETSEWLRRHDAAIAGELRDRLNIDAPTARRAARDARREIEARRVELAGDELLAQVRTRAVQLCVSRKHCPACHATPRLAEFYALRRGSPERQRVCIRCDNTGRATRLVLELRRPGGQS